MNKKLIATIATVAVALTVSSSAIALADNGKGKDRLGSLLSGLVAKGTITQSQADAIVKAQTDAMVAGKAAMDKNRAAEIAIVTSTLGITEDALKTRIKAGESLATIAGAKKDALIAALVTFKYKEITDAQTAGKITADQATKMKANITARVTQMVNNLRPPKGPHGPDGDNDGDIKGGSKGAPGGLVIPGTNAGTTKLANKTKIKVVRA
jgi:polyhydroxyalkanoate synthesis regulator phasin